MAELTDEDIENMCVRRRAEHAGVSPNAIRERDRVRLLAEVEQRLQREIILPGRATTVRAEMVAWERLCEELKQERDEARRRAVELWEHNAGSIQHPPRWVEIYRKELADD